MDWDEDMSSNLWVFPAGLKRKVAEVARSIRWVSKYGSVIVSGYEVGTADGLNEKGLAANLLYLAESEYPKPSGKRPVLSIAAWAQYALDNYATVDEAVSTLLKEPFNLVWPPALPNGTPAALHLSIWTPPGFWPYSNMSRKAGRSPRQAISGDDQFSDFRSATRHRGILAERRRPRFPTGDQSRRRPIRPRRLPARRHSQEDRPALHQECAGPVLRQSSGGERFERAARGQRAAGVATPDQPNIASTLWRVAADQNNSSIISTPPRGRTHFGSRSPS